MPFTFRDNFVIFFFLFYSLEGFCHPLDLENFSTKDFFLSSAKTGCMPKGMKIDPVGNTLYVAEMCGQLDPLSRKRFPSASLFDVTSRTLLKTLKTPQGMKTHGILANTEVEFSLDELWGFITRAEGDAGSEIYQNMGLLTVVNTESQKIAKYIPLHSSGAKIISIRPYLKQDPRRSQIVYVANYFSDNISIVDVTLLKENGNLDGSEHFKGKIELHTNFKNPASRGYFVAPRGIAFTPDGQYALILATETGSLIILDAVNHRQMVEIAPIPKELAGRDLNLRHIVLSKKGETAYLSHMRGNAISRINMTKLIETVKNLKKVGSGVTLPGSFWSEILIPFKTNQGLKKILVLENYPKDHPNFPNARWSLAHPNTIILDPIQNRYLYVSHRTTSDQDINKVDPKIMGKIDIIDLALDRIVFSLVGGAQPTALEITHNGQTLISAGLIDDKLIFFDVQKLQKIYER